MKKLKRYNDYSDLDFYEGALEDHWCLADDVDELEESHQRLLDALNFVLEHDMGDYKTADEFGGYVLDEDIRAFIQDAISKSIQ